jgi:hypothetical protein
MTRTKQKYVASECTVCGLQVSSRNDLEIHLHTQAAVGTSYCSKCDYHVPLNCLVWHNQSPQSMHLSSQPEDARTHYIPNDDVGFEPPPIDVAPISCKLYRCVCGQGEETNLYPESDGLVSVQCDSCRYWRYVSLSLYHHHLFFFLLSVFFLLEATLPAAIRILWKVFICVLNASFPPASHVSRYRGTVALRVIAIYPPR